MARQIQSPGVQISEIDLSLRAAGNPITTVLIPGFASKGPISEAIKVGSVSEFEQIYGQPTNAAERYFYHSTKAVLQSPSDVLVYRLPYGDGQGIDTSNNFSALVYPVVAYTGALSSTALNGTSANYFFGKPTHLSLTQEEYVSILKGDGFAWSPDTGGATTFNGVASLSAAGIVVLNKAQSSINNRFEGYYINIADNTNLNPATDFDSIQRILTVNSTSPSIAGGSYVELPSARLNFALSASTTGVGNSLAEAVENIPTFDISSNQYDDTVIFSVVKLRQSVFAPDTIALDYVISESVVGSFDANRQINGSNGGPSQSFSLEVLDNNLLQASVLINPYISNKNRGTWLDINGVPTKKVRFLGSRLATPLPGESNNAYTLRVGAPQDLVQGFREILGDADAAVALGDYLNQNLNTKEIGNLPGKISNMLNVLDNQDLYTLNLVIEAGLGTVYVNSLNPATSGYFDDYVPFDSMFNGLTAQRSSSQPEATILYNQVAGEFVTFAESRRKDCLFIADPLTNILVSGGLKTVADTTKIFTSDIYWPLRNQFSGIDTSYACTFATVARVADVASSLQVYVPFSGFAAASMANTDTNYQPWYAPAGFTRGVVGGISDIAMYPKQKQRDDLYKVNLNPVAFFPAEGFVIFGQKTLQKKPSAFDRINVRRMFLNLETATRDTMKYFVFEPNTLFTRTQVINTLTPIFENAKNTQGIYDYLIICDERNNTSTVIDDNALVVDIYIKPVRTAEFILANFYATRTGVNFQEIVT